MEFLAHVFVYVFAVIILLVASSLSAVIMYAVMRLLGLTDFVADVLYSIKEAAVEIWRMIAKG